MTDIIELEGVEKSYGDFEVLKGIDFSVEEGEIFGILGPNGVGKTTLFQTVLGLLRQDSGTVKIKGTEHTQSKEIKEKIGYLPSDISFYEGMSARENLEFFTELAGTDPDLDDLLDLVGLEDDADRSVGDFSTGMKKRLGIAQSMIKDPEIIIYDEPTTGLDPQGKKAFKDLVKKINRERGKTIIISSHITTEIDTLCDRFAILSDGKVEACGTRHELSSETDTDSYIRLKTEDREASEKILDEMDVEYEAGKKELEILAEDDIRSKLFDRLMEEDIDVEAFEMEEETLETTYLKLTGGG
ncbi:ABC transporter ATP-binding protein [Candidatus Nanosalina sp. VS9-1]|uniref:ABC transporter ATP-binding protein n=1 Tax=Candidatus Nanosalina sp. VS9-1 TaxID=3388566 RepID=UPI0039E04EB9